jgi:hypothetical protein
MLKRWIACAGNSASSFNEEYPESLCHGPGSLKAAGNQAAEENYPDSSGFRFNSDLELQRRKDLDQLVDRHVTNLA